MLKNLTNIYLAANERPAGGFTMTDGMVQITDGPGLGVEVDRDVIARYGQKP